MSDGASGGRVLPLDSPADAVPHGDPGLPWGMRRGGSSRLRRRSAALPAGRRGGAVAIGKEKKGVSRPGKPLAELREAPDFEPLRVEIEKARMLAGAACRWPRCDEIAAPLRPAPTAERPRREPAEDVRRRRRGARTCAPHGSRRFAQRQAAHRGRAAAPNSGTDAQPGPREVPRLSPAQAAALLPPQPARIGGCTTSYHGTRATSATPPQSSRVFFHRAGSAISCPAAHDARLECSPSLIGEAGAIRVSVRAG